MDSLFEQDYLTVETLQQLGAYLLSAVAFILILVAGHYVAKWVHGRIRGTLDRPAVDRTLTRFAGNFAYYGIFLLALFAALETLGVETASFVAVLAATGFAIGLALQGTLSNFAAGILLLLFRPFDVGDYIEVSDETGFVYDIQLFFTRITTRDNRLVIIPNDEIFDSTIHNLFAHEVVRIDCDVGTDYPADIDATREVLLEAARSVEGRIQEEGEQAALLGLGDSAINWQVRIWGKPEEYFRLRQELIRAVKYALDEADIGIPYPQMDVHVDDLNAEVEGK